MDDAELGSSTMEKSRKRRKNYVVEDEEDEDFRDGVNSEREHKVDEEEDPNEEDDSQKSERSDQKNRDAGDEEIEEQEVSTEDPISETRETSESQVIVSDVQEEEDAEETEENGVDETKVDAEETEETENDTEPNPEELHATTSPQSQDVSVDEAAIKAALMKRGDELKSRAETLTLTIVRQILAKDLGLEVDGLDMHKKFIRGLVDELLQEGDEEPVVNPAKDKKPMKKDTTSKREGKSSKPKSSTGKRRLEAKKEEEAEEHLEKNDSAPDNASQEEKPVKERKKQKQGTEEKPKTIPIKKSVDEKRPFSARVERLRDILKHVGIGVSPAIYRKAKQAPEHERDDLLVKELELRLVQEGLSANPTEKEIRKVKARNEKKRDLDGIDDSNIVVEPRRRAAATDWFAARPNKYLQAQSGGQDSDEEPKPTVTGAMDEVMDD